MSPIRNNKNDQKPLDKNQEEYRELFGIEDKFLIQMSYDETTRKGYVVYIDKEDDINWVDTRDFEEERRNRRDAYITELNMVLYSPIPNVSCSDSEAFKKILGSGYVLALEDRGEKIPSVIENASHFINERNKEKSREMFLSASGVVSMLIAFLGVLDLCLWKWKPSWVTGLTLGVLGSFVSVWMRYGKISFTGLSSRMLHYLEAVSRLAIGAVFAMVAICAVKCGLILTNIAPSMQVYSYALIGFIAGFSERYIPSIVEHLVNEKQ